MKNGTVQSSDSYLTAKTQGYWVKKFFSSESNEKKAWDNDGGERETHSLSCDNHL